MSAKTSIEWTDKSSNPLRAYDTVTGKRGWFCVHASAGCVNCYAEKLNGWVGNHLAYAAQNLKRVRFEMHRPELRTWAKLKAGTKVFAFDMTDLFQDGVPDELIDQAFAAMATSKATFQILTKRAARLLAYGQGLAALDPKQRSLRMVESMYRGHPAEDLVRGSKPVYVGDFPWPLPNVWLGISCEDQANADERIQLLLQTPAAVRFVSYEPALGPVDFGAFAPFSFKPIHPEVRRELLGMYPGGLPANSLNAKLATMRVAWVIVGGESGPGARPFDVEWARSTVRQCKNAGVPVFVKQLGARPYQSPRHDGGTGYELGLKSKKGGDPAEWPSDLVCREFPKEAA